MKNRNWMLSATLALLLGAQTVAAKGSGVDTELRSYKAADTSQQIVSDYIVAIVNNEPITYHSETGLMLMQECERMLDSQMAEQPPENPDDNARNTPRNS